jgi:Asp-tRNA(Asn)/Glu-tRNA(Gln) amidotransferase A subunit family amidase
LDRIKARNDWTSAYVTVIEDAAREAAREAERAVESGAPLGRLHGVPIAIKDLFEFKAGVRNTFGSKPLAGSMPRESATHVERLEGAGAIVLGNTNTPEFGHKGGDGQLPFRSYEHAGRSWQERWRLLGR